MQSRKLKKINKNCFIFIFFILLVTGYWLLVTYNSISASTLDDLRTKMEERNKQIEQIKKEIEEYQKQLDQTVSQKTTLKNELSHLEISRKKLVSDIDLTEKQIEATNFNIERLELEILLKEKEIENKKEALSEILRNLNEQESQTLIEITLAHDEFSDFFTDLERMENFQNEINLNLSDLKKIKSLLEGEKEERESEKEKLEGLKSKFFDQKVIVDSTKKQKNQLFNETKNKEENYRKLLADRLAKKEALEDEIRQIEEQMRIEIDPNSLPRTGSGVLKWPVDSVTITQFFGNTSFATQNPQVYKGQGHNGIDLRASIGVPIKAALEGIVMAVGNTDAACYGVSYGKWVLVQHPNGLSTLYAHLSLVKVSQGQKVNTGEVIGYSGNTGFTTGPHLHFTVFATAGVRIGQIKSKICGTMMILPVASYNSYLNPLSYL